MSPLIEGVIQIVGVTGTGNDLDHSQAQQGNHIEEEGCSLPPRTHQATNNLMILNDVVPACGLRHENDKSLVNSLPLCK